MILAGFVVLEGLVSPPHLRFISFGGITGKTFGIFGDFL